MPEDLAHVRAALRRRRARDQRVARATDVEFEERAAILEFDAGLDRVAAEQRAREELAAKSSASRTRVRG